MTIFFRLLETDDKGTALHQAIQQLAQKEPDPITFAVESESFQQVPGATFAYWVSEKIRHTFSKLPSIQMGSRKACFGLSTKDDFRFVRLCWEVELVDIQNTWSNFVKGGAFSRFYADPYLLLEWKEDGKCLKAFADRKTAELFGTASWSRWINNWDTYFNPGINWSRRSQRGLSLRAFPSGCIFSDKAPVIFDEKRLLLPLLAITNSLPFTTLVSLQMAFGSYEVGVIQRTPVPDLDSESTITLANLARRAWSLKRSLDTVTQTSHAFVFPALLQVGDFNLSATAGIWTDKVTAIETELAQIQTQIDDLVFALYGISEEVGSMQRAEGSEQNSELPTAYSEPPTDEDEEESEAISADLPTLTRELLDYLCSVAFGRFDVRLATGEREFPSEPEPFDPLPVCFPGMLVAEKVSSIQQAEGSNQTSEPPTANCLPPTSPSEVPTGYPIQIPFDRHSCRRRRTPERHHSPYPPSVQRHLGRERQRH